MSLRRRLRLLVEAVRIAGLLILALYRAVTLLLGLKLRSKYYAWRERRGFKKTLARHGLPPDLAGELAAMYSERLASSLRVPGPVELARKAGFPWTRGRARRPS